MLTNFSGLRVTGIQEKGKSGRFLGWSTLLTDVPHQHIMHKLENLPWGSDWREFCATTPVRFNNMEFLGAQECIISVRMFWGAVSTTELSYVHLQIWGVYGQWEVDDWRC